MNSVPTAEQLVAQQDRNRECLRNAVLLNLANVLGEVDNVVRNGGLLFYHNIGQCVDCSLEIGVVLSQNLQIFYQKIAADLCWFILSGRRIGVIFLLFIS